METELEKLEAEMKKLRVDFLKKSDLDVDKLICIEADIDCDFKLELVKEWLLTKIVMRGSKYFVNFSVRKEGTLTLCIGTSLPQDFMHTYSGAVFSNAELPRLATTFPDFCWLHADGTTPSTLNEVATVVRESEKLGDLTWVLPSKLADDFVEMMHTLNQSIISGLMQDAILYAPFIKTKEQFIG